MPATTITVDIRFYQASGIGTYLQNLLPALRRCLPEIRFVLLIDPADRSRIEQDLPGCELIEVRSRPLSVMEQHTVPRILPPETALLWIPHINIPLRFGGPLLVTLHDIILREPPARRTPGALVRYWYVRLVLRRIARHAAAILCDSEFTRREWQRYYGRSGGLRVAPLGVPPRWSRLGDERTARSWTAPNPPRILFVGNIKPHKNLPRLVRAFQKIADQIPHELVIAGRVAGLRSIDAEIAGSTKTVRNPSETGSRVRLAGRVSDAELKALMAGADLFVFPSLYEGFGLPPLEAMAAGVPVAAADIPVVREVCGDAPAYFDPTSVDDMARCMLAILRDPDLRAELTRRGRAHAAAATWERSVQRTAAVIRSLAIDQDPLVALRGPPLEDYRDRMLRNPLVRENSTVTRRLAAGGRPLVSVVTVVWNGAVTIRNAIESVLTQTYGHIEYVVVDGGSTDGTREIIAEFAERLAWTVSERDEGISDAFNRGVALCNGEIIGILNADDWYEADTVERVVTALANGGDVACGRLQYWRAGVRDAIFPSLPERLGIDMTVNHPTMFVRREAYLKTGLFKTEYRYAMDYELALRFRRFGLRFVSLDRVLANMRYAGAGDRNWWRGLLEMRRAQRELYRGSAYFALRFPLKLARALVGRVLAWLGLGWVARLYRSRLSYFRRTYAADEK